MLTACNTAFCQHFQQTKVNKTTLQRASTVKYRNKRPFSPFAVKLNVSNFCKRNDKEKNQNYILLYQPNQKIATFMPKI